MPQESVQHLLDSQTCVCCMCRCGEHKCFDQQALELPLFMQKYLYFDKNLKKRYEELCAPETSLYSRTTYKDGFCQNREKIVRFPIEKSAPPGNLRMNSETGFPSQTSLSANDFIPYSLEDQEILKAKSMKPEEILKRYIPPDPQKVIKECRKYYCPPHCVGVEKSPVKENCLLDFKEKFNLGARGQKPADSLPQISSDVFEKRTNYMLDYKGPYIPPTKKQIRAEIYKPPCPMSSDTSYKNDFSAPPDMQDKRSSKSKGDPKDDHVKGMVGGTGPMADKTTFMLDYGDPDVQANVLEKAPRQEYQPPTSSMETITTNQIAYPRWTDLPKQVVKPRKASAKKPLDDDSYRQHETDFRRLITSYQEDFGGIDSALCPCKVVQKYGPKVLEPRYFHAESEKPHDIFYCTKKDDNFCPH